jgi:hypothetical protein
MINIQKPSSYEKSHFNGTVFFSVKYVWAAFERLKKSGSKELQAMEKYEQIQCIARDKNTQKITKSVRKKFQTLESRKKGQGFCGDFWEQKK